MKLPIRDGNLKPAVRDSLVVVGLALVFIGIKFLSGWLAYSCAVIGLVLGSIGAYAGRAALFGLRPFGESPWRQAKRTYTDASDEDNSSKKNEP